MLQFNSGQSLIGPDGLLFPSGEVLLDYDGRFSPQSVPPPYRVGLVPAPVSIVPIPNSPVLPLESGNYQVFVANVPPTAATINGTVIRTRQLEPQRVGRLDLRIFFVGIAGLDDPVQTIIDEFNRTLGAAGQLGTITLQDYPQDRHGVDGCRSRPRRQWERSSRSDGRDFHCPGRWVKRTLDVFLLTEIIGASGLVIGHSGAIPGAGPSATLDPNGRGCESSPGQPQDAWRAQLTPSCMRLGITLAVPYNRDPTLAVPRGDPLVDTPFCTTIGFLPNEACPDVSDLMFPQVASVDQ